jgi:hypothetical protein
VVERLALDPVVAAQALGHRLRVGEDLARLRDELIVAVADPLAQARAVGVRREVVERRAPEVVGRAVLVEYPEDLARVRDRVGRELHPDDEVHRPAVRLGHVEETPRQSAAHDLLGRIPLEGDGGDLGVVAGRDESATQALGVRLGAAPREGDLRRADQDVADGHKGSEFIING